MRRTQATRGETEAELESAWLANLEADVFRMIRHLCLGDGYRPTAAAAEIAMAADCVAGHCCLETGFDPETGPWMRVSRTDEAARRQTESSRP